MRQRQLTAFGAGRDLDADVAGLLVDGRSTDCMRSPGKFEPARTIDDPILADMIDHFVTAANDPDLRDAITHPERVPLLPLDVGYFACQHGRARIAVSDHRNNDAAAPRETAALRRLQTAYERFHREVVALPECGRL